jgi:ABC-type uncharacterized transport system involved in gliding motility auxiliary subunit
VQITKKFRLQLLAQSGAFIVLLLALVTLSAYLAHEYRYEYDATAGARNTLAPGTLDVLRQLDGPLNITAFALAKDASGANLQKALQERMRTYLRAKPDIVLTLVDPREDPKRARAAAIRSPNELVIEYLKRVEHLPLGEFNEQNFANALIRLSRASTAVVYWLDGHGERKLDGIANHDLGEFGRQLQLKGYKVTGLNLAIAQDIPRNAALLIIASPQANLQDEEVNKIQRFVDSGGNLLWLIDPEPLRGLEPVAEFLGLVLTPGTVVDPTLKPRSGPPIMATADSYSRHPITGSFRINTLFPGARQIGTAERDEWRITPLLEVAPRGWVETGNLDEKPVFDKSSDVPGPINIATAYERTTDDRQQRIVVVGNGHFLSNAFLGNGGNLQLGLSTVHWLSGDDKLIAIPPRPAGDTRLDITQNTLYMIAFVFLLILPLAFAGAGIFVWWRRRRAV